MRMKAYGELIPSITGRDLSGGFEGGKKKKKDQHLPVKCHRTVLDDVCVIVLGGKERKTKQRPKKTKCVKYRGGESQGDISCV